MAVLHDLWDISNDFYEIRAEVTGVGRGVSNTFDSRDSAKELEKLAEGNIAFFEVFAVAIDGLSKEGDFFGSEFGESAHFSDDVLGWAGTFASSSSRYDAECTEFVAAVLDGDVGFCFAFSFEVALRNRGNDIAFSFR